MLVQQKGLVTEIGCDSAAEFIAVLDPVLGPFSQPAHLDLYVFRGVNADHYGLLPAAYRTGTSFLHQARWVHPPLATIGDQCAAEFQTLLKFFDTAARHGIRLPEDSQLLRRQLEEWSGKFFRAEPDNPILWPPPELLSLVALAQHYGVPTRALDWSWSSLTAAYFAVRNVMDTQTGNICVWIFSYIAKELGNFLATERSDERPLILFTAPGSDNDNLRAQRGLFMSQIHRVTDRDAPFTPEPYENLLPSTVPGIISTPITFRVLAPCAEAPQIRWFLSAAGITAARLFPGLWGVAREFEEERTIYEGVAMAPPTEFAATVQREIMSAFKNRGA